MGEGDERGAAWREWLGMHLLETSDGRSLGYAWGWRSCSPWHAYVGGAAIGEFASLDEARNAIETVIAARHAR